MGGGIFNILKVCTKMININNKYKQLELFTIYPTLWIYTIRKQKTPHEEWFQKAMGHSSINVSLTYLRGLEVPELSEEDMPVI